jgi:hypothetical protein
VSLNLLGFIDDSRAVSLLTRGIGTQGCAKRAAEQSRECAALLEINANILEDFVRYGVQ